MIAPSWQQLNFSGAVSSEKQHGCILYSLGGFTAEELVVLGGCEQQPVLSCIFLQRSQ
jgi:hypothetical protein